METYLPSYEEALQSLIDMRLSEGEAIWNQAMLIFVLVEYHKAKPGDIAVHLNCSAQYVLDMARTFRVFPGDETRAKDMPFSIHKICAKTKDPQGWLAKAVKEGYSTRELQQAVRGETVKDELREAQAAWHKVEKILEAGGPGAEWLKEQIRSEIVCPG